MEEHSRVIICSDNGVLLNINEIVSIFAFSSHIFSTASVAKMNQLLPFYLLSVGIVFISKVPSMSHHSEHLSIFYRFPYFDLSCFNPLFPMVAPLIFDELEINRII